MISRKTTNEDIPGLLSLQKQNLISELTDEQKASNGFVTTPFTIAQLEEIIELGGAYVTAIEDQIVAYLLGGSWPYYEQWPIFPYMTARFPKWKTEGLGITIENSFQYGPVCIDSRYRGQKIINQLFETMRQDFIKRYPLAGTFINQANPRSTKAHLKLGWQITDEFDYNGNSYFGLVYDMNQKVPQ